MKKLLISLILLFYLFVSIPVQAAENGVAYHSWTTDHSGKIVSTQEAYLALRVIRNIEVINSDMDGFKLATEIYYEESSQTFYLADTGHTIEKDKEKIKMARILKSTDTFLTATSIGESILQNPQGVFVTPNGNIYVADYDLQKVIVFNQAGDVVNEYGKPTHPLYGEGMTFRPTKIVVDAVGTMYIVDSGNANGLVQITEDGSFLGYFGANYTTPSFSYIIRFMFSTKAQKKKLYRSPIAPTNMAIDHDGLINTVTKGLTGNALKKLNISGENRFPDNMIDSNTFNDVSVGPIGNLYTISENGYIYEYDIEGNLLFAFGGKDSTGKYIGLFSNPQSIEVDENYHLYVIDHVSDQSIIQVFERTEFASLVHQSLKYYQDGFYAKSREPWEQVLKRNNMFDLAHAGLGDAYLQELRYEEAMYHFRLAGDINGYSEAFWEVRNNWIMNYGTYIILSILGLVVLYLILNYTHVLEPVKQGIRRGKESILTVKLLREISYITTFIKHPVNGFYEVKKNNKISSLAGIILYFIFYLEMIASNVFTGFIFNPIDIETVSIVKIFFLSVLPILLAVLCNYLISSITVGNGRLKDTFIGFICAFAPVILFLPFVILISNVLTLNESIIYDLAKSILWGWSFLLLYIMVKEIQELNFGENNKNIFITLLTMILFVAFSFLLYILGSQVYNFIKEIIIEVISNG